jgi:two-component system nitrogen regulation response regulator GlnG
MQDPDSTLTSPLSSSGHGTAALLCATIVWHPDRSRIGEQSIAIGAVLELSRYLPLFQGPGRMPSGLGFNGISRECVRIVRDGADNLFVQPPATRMAGELNGVELDGPGLQGVQLTRRQVEDGAVLGLGRAVLVCLHWMRGLPRDNPVPGFLGVGAAAVAARDAIRQAAAGDAPVLLTGETGSGKEVVARAVHAMSRRKGGPFVPVNMAALSESLAPADLFGAAKGAYTGAQTARRGLFAEAQDGTLFLDEIGNAPASVQPMLLRVLESGDYRPLGAGADARAGARVIAATDQDIYGGGFNQALLRRLEGFAIDLPPLRRRREDLGVLLLQMLGEEGAGLVLPFPLVSRLANHGWPGNVRQLRNVAQRCVLALRCGAEIDPDALLGKSAPAAVPAAVATAAAGRPERESADAIANPLAIAPARQSVRRKPSELAEQQVLAALDNNGWCILDAANELGISRPSMYKLLEACPQVRRAEQIPQEEVRAALARCGGDVQACATALRTPSEALRRRLRSLELVP